MIKIFIDSDIILDLLAKRDNFSAAYELMKILNNGKVLAFTSPIVITNVHYVLSKILNRNKSIHAIKILRKKIRILTIDEEIIDNALVSVINDFEDSIQILAAEKYLINFIITRNKKDFLESKVKVLDAAEFIDFYNNAENIEKER